MTKRPALCLIAVPGRRRRMLELAQEVEKRGYAGIFSPSPFGNMSLCEALSWKTDSITFGTAIAPIYQRTITDFAQSAAVMHEVSGGRFRLGIGVAHHPSHIRMGVTPGKPLGDIRNFVTKFRAQEGLGDLPPIVIAALRKKMVALAGEIAEGVVFANASLSHMGTSLAALPEAKRNDPNFFIGNMIPTCISDDVEAAKAVNRRTLTNYGFLPNYRNYWKEAGYEAEMAAIETAIAEGRNADVPGCFSDKWLDDNSLFGPAGKVKEKVQAWQDAGVKDLIIVPSSAAGNQLKALEEVFATFG
jgi:alkanesulfonate monooxygenase SsuD/methylene tetrahydromethanopterin reductase-like flavin-dependent oxidoreductase (luciferase family)